MTRLTIREVACELNLFLRDSSDHREHDYVGIDLRGGAESATRHIVQSGDHIAIDDLVLRAGDTYSATTSTQGGIHA